MKRSMRVLAFGVLATMAVAAPASALTVTTTSDANVLTNTILGPGITIVGTPTYSANTTGGSGTFSGGLASGIGINSGIILTTGTAAGAVGPNNQDGFTGSGTFSQLDFDFTSAGGSVFFNYVFASEEYNEFTNSQFNDSFTLKVDGTNIALIPSTTTPVQINTVNGGNPFGTGASNPQYFVNNDLNDGGPFHNIQYDGFTKVFTATTTVGAGTHHMEFFITDLGDSSLDSAVFVQAGSFSENETPVPLPATLLLMGAGLVAMGGYARTARRASK